MLAKPCCAVALETADHLDLVRPEIVQNAYSLLREDVHGVLPIIATEELAYTPYSPLARGLLTRRYSKGEQPAQGSRASTGPRVPELLNNPEVIDRIQRFDEMATAFAISSAGLAMAWIMSQSCGHGADHRSASPRSGMHCRKPQLAGNPEMQSNWPLSFHRASPREAVAQP